MKPVEIRRANVRENRGSRPRPPKNPITLIRQKEVRAARDERVPCVGFSRQAFQPTTVFRQFPPGAATTRPASRDPRRRRDRLWRAPSSGPVQTEDCAVPPQKQLDTAPMKAGENLRRRRQVSQPRNIPERNRLETNTRPFAGRCSPWGPAAPTRAPSRHHWLLG